MQFWGWALLPPGHQPLSIKGEHPADGDATVRQGGTCLCAQEARSSCGWLVAVVAASWPAGKPVCLRLLFCFNLSAALSFQRERAHLTRSPAQPPTAGWHWAAWLAGSRAHLQAQAGM